MLNPFEYTFTKLVPYLHLVLTRFNLSFSPLFLLLPLSHLLYFVRFSSPLLLILPCHSDCRVKLWSYVPGLTPCLPRRVLAIKGRATSLP